MAGQRRVPLTQSRAQAIYQRGAQDARNRFAQQIALNPPPPRNEALQRQPTPTAPSTMVSDALRTQETARVGNTVAISQTGEAIFQTVNNYPYLKDIKPPETQSETVSLDTEPMFSAYCTLVMGYTYNKTEEEPFITGVGDGDELTVGIREHRALIRFGVSAAPHLVEVDVCEGGVVSIPGSSCGVSILDYTFDRSPVNGANGIGLRSQCHLASGGGASPATYTERIFCPYQVAVDPLDPPTVETLIEQLKLAICERSIVTVATP